MDPTINIGGKRFNARGGGQLTKDLPPIGKQQLRLISGVSAPTAIESIGAIASLGTNVFPFTAPRRIISIFNVNANIRFFDNSGGGAYDVSERAIIVIAQSQVVNLDTKGVAGLTQLIVPNNSPQNLSIIAEVNSTNQITFTATVYGGDVERITGITPALNDTVQCTFTVTYEPLL